MLLPLSVLLKLEEAPELDSSEPRHCLTLIGPKGQKLAPYIQVLTLLCLLRQRLSDSLQLRLFETEHGIASSPFSIDGLSLLDAESFLC